MEVAKKRRNGKDYWHSSNQILSIFAVGLSAGVFGPALIDLAEIYTSEPNDVALVNSTRALAMLIGSMIGSSFFKFLNDQILMVVSLFAYAVTTTLIVFFSNLWVLHVLAVAGGCVIGIFEIGSQVRLVKIWGKKSAAALQAFHTAFGVGAMVAPFLAAPFLSVRGADVIIQGTRLWIPYSVFALVFLLVLISMIGAYIVDPVGIQQCTKEESHTADKQRRTFENTLVTGLFFYILFTVNTETTYSSLLSNSVFKSPQLQFSKLNAVYISGVFWTTFTAGRAVSIFAALFVDIPTLLVFSHVLLIIASGMMIIFETSAFCAWTGTALLGLGISSLYGAATGYTFQYFRVRHFHVSVIMVAGCVGVVVSSYFVPPIVEAWPLFLQLYTGTGNVLHFIVLIAMFWCTRGRECLQQAEDVPL